MYDRSFFKPSSKCYKYFKINFVIVIFALSISSLPTSQLKLSMIIFAQISKILSHNICIYIYVSWNSRVIFIYAFLFFIAVLRKLLLYSRPWVFISQFHSSFSTCWNTCVIFNYRFLFFMFINYTSSDVVGFCDFSNTSAPSSNLPSIFGFFSIFSFPYNAWSLWFHCTQDTY